MARGGREKERVGAHPVASRAETRRYVSARYYSYAGDTLARHSGRRGNITFFSPAPLRRQIRTLFYVCPSRSSPPLSVYLSLSLFFHFSSRPCTAGNDAGRHAKLRATRILALPTCPRPRHGGTSDVRTYSSSVRSTSRPRIRDTLIRTVICSRWRREISPSRCLRGNKEARRRSPLTASLT